jgi:hypothetical protein
MISKKHLHEFIKKNKPNDLKKNNFFEISVRLGKNLYRNCYDYNISLADFEKLVTIYREKDEIKTDKIKYSKYHQYQYNQLNLIVLPDGYSICYKYNQHKYYRYQYKGTYETRLVCCLRSQHSPMTFPTLFKYDNVIEVEKLIFPLEEKIKLAMYKKVDQEGFITYEVSLEIELGADFEKVVEHIKTLQQNAN